MSSAPANLILEAYGALPVLTLIVPMIFFVDPHVCPLGFHFSSMFGYAFGGHILFLLPCWVCLPLGPASCFVTVSVGPPHLCLRETEPDSLRWQVDFRKFFLPRLRMISPFLCYKQWTNSQTVSGSPHPVRCLFQQKEGFIWCCHSRGVTACHHHHGGEHVSG